MTDPPPPTDPWDRLRTTHRAVDACFGSLLPEEASHRPEPGTWRPVDDLRHLTLATEALIRACSLTGEELEARFGLATGPSRPCREIGEAGSRALQGGATSPPAMVPEGAGEVPVELEDALAGWRAAAARLEALEERWSAEELDRYRVPHPFLGLLTFREWLCFNHVHARHHIRVAQGRVGRTEAP